MAAVLRVLLDLSVIPDLLLRRNTGVAEVESIWQATRESRLELHMVASDLIGVYFYITRRLAGGREARRVVRECLDALTILPVDQAVLEQAYELPNPDLEDALKIACAARANLDAIITLEPSRFAGSPVAVLSPAELATRLAMPPATS